MPKDILSTKNHIPPIRSGLVQRERLLSLLNQGLNGKLTLVSSPAGFGKTTLVSDWVTRLEHTIGWLSLDEGDNNQNRFTINLIKVMQQISKGFANEVLEMFNSAKPHNTEEVFPYLINQISNISDPFLIVMDDYHLINNPSIHNLILQILNKQPHNMHLLISTRSDPPWPLARWRARGELSEVRIKDLRFNLEEITTFLNGSMKLNLSQEDIQFLEKKTEGWVASLQLVALSIKKQGDAHDFIRNFTGNHRFVFDYLIDEVFQDLPQNIQSFLLQTSTINRFSADLCDYVRDSNDSQQIIDNLEKINLFIVPLDNTRTWYRYHHLFSDVLRNIITKQNPEQKNEIHGKAQKWFQTEGLISEAIYHGVERGNFDQVADLIENNFTGLIEHRDLLLISEWIATLPETTFQSHPWLRVAIAYINLFTGSPKDVLEQIQQLEHFMKENPDFQNDKIRSYIAFIRSRLNIISGDLDTALKFAHQAYNYLSQEDKQLNCLVLSTIGALLQRLGLFDEATKMFEEGISVGREIADSNALISLYGDLIGLFVESGQLFAANLRCQEALQYIEKRFRKYGRYTPGASHIFFRLSTILRHWNKLEDSLLYAKKCDSVLNQWGLKNRLASINLAIAQHSIGNFSEAHQVLEDTLNYVKNNSEYWLEDIKACQALFWVIEGNLEFTSHWVLEQKLDSHEKINYKSQLLFRTLAHVRLAQGRLGDTSATQDLLRFLPKLIEVFEKAGATAYLIQSLIILSLAYQLNNKQELAINALIQALSYGEKGDYIWVFLREGQPMESLLNLVINQQGITPYLDKISKGFENLSSGSKKQEEKSTLSFNKLTARELEVLYKLDSDLTVPEIAEQLIISIGTTRTHIKHIYRKLNVHSRFEAVVCAKEQQLF